MLIKNLEIVCFRLCILSMLFFQVSIADDQKEAVLKDKTV